jgi:hypothetical protein
MCVPRAFYRCFFAAATEKERKGKEREMKGKEWKGNEKGTRQIEHSTLNIEHNLHKCGLEKIEL